jgi:competence CoiA-like predicted nuclease
VLTSPPQSLERLYKLFKTVGYILTWCLNLTTASLHFILFTSQTSLWFPLSNSNWLWSNYVLSASTQFLNWKYHNGFSKIKFSRQALPLMIIERNNVFQVWMLNQGKVPKKLNVHKQIYSSSIQTSHSIHHSKF